MLKKISLIFITMFIILAMISNVFAAEVKNTLEVVQQASETKDLDDNQGYISKTIVDSNAETGEVTIELKINNSKKEQEDTETYENTEIYLMVSENIATDEEKLTKNINNIEKLVTKIFNQNSKTKVGIIGIKGTIRDGKIDEETGKLISGEKDELDVNGSADNAEIVVGLTNSLDVIKNGLQNMNSSKTNYRTNLQAAIRLANKSYSNNTNKILISLYDSVPSIAIGVPSTYSYGGLFAWYSTAEEAITAVHENVSTNTKNEILTLKTSKVSFILLRPDDTSYDEKWYSNETGEFLLDFDGSPYVQKLYGTIDKPTYGKMYSFTDENIDKVITENIYEDVSNLIQPDINTVKIVDYFPEDIMDNFEFSYVNEPSIGTTSKAIDAETNSITWNIETLKGEEVATLKYKLKIKDMQNTELLEKVISTNEKVELTYKDTEEESHSTTLTSSPKIKLTQIKINDDTGNGTGSGNNNGGTVTPPKDDTTMQGKLPQTGVSLAVGISSIIISILGIIFYRKSKKYTV